MKNWTSLGILFIALVFAACGNQENGQENGAEETAQPTIEELKQKISEKEEVLFNETRMVDPEKGMEMIGLYQDFANLYPDEKETPRYLYLAADIAGAINKPKIKVDNYKRILEKYPNYKGKDNVVYLLAFTLDAELNFRDEARKYYEETVKTGADTNLVRDAKIRLETIDSLTFDQLQEKIISGQLLN